MWFLLVVLIVRFQRSLWTDVSHCAVNPLLELSWMCPVAQTCSDVSRGHLALMWELHVNDTNTTHTHFHLWTRPWTDLTSEYKWKLREYVWLQHKSFPLSAVSPLLIRKCQPADHQTNSQLFSLFTSCSEHAESWQRLQALSKWNTGHSADSI